MFLCLALFLAVFIRRVIIFARKSGLEKKEIDEPQNGKDDVSKKRLSKSDKRKVAALVEKAEEKLKFGKEAEAVKLFVQALAIDSLNKEGQLKLAMLYMQKQMYGAAAVLFESLGNITNDAVHFSHMGLALYQQQQFEAARAAYQKAVDLDPSRPQRFVSLAQVYRSLGQLQNAIIALNKAVEMEKENTDFLLLLADIQMEMKNYDDAEVILKKVSESDPKNEEVEKLLKDVEEKRKETAGA